MKRSLGETRNNVLCKHGYQESVCLMYGVLGRGNRVELPECVVKGVRSVYPDEDNRYIGHRDE